ncbi:uracil-DNA glycosylase [Syntrophomonas wolfei]|jgi:DNA polymerase|uniref:Type-4 uracil-DNA glycosylase n=1 Tax=Syntrophomonas wolfei TaxID=863 RepID=A0A354YXT8_9FIRM|nr:uracil-DNA glycosylase [Syntrophomonas wolfei]HBK54163.1 uracil-DNA glycosylase [Syntrophomonas wolfei]
MSSEQPSLFELLPGEELYRQEKQVAAKEIHSPFLPGIKVEEAFPGIKEAAPLEELARNCNNCRLRSGCRQVVFSDGDVKSRIMFIGEGPGKDEDEQGRPFVGKAGQLLDKILVAAEIPRSQVYISNVVKCRPPGNRLPNPDEVRECRNYLEAQIRIMQPAIIVCLGAMASQVIIDPKASVSKIRGKWFNRQGVKIMATYHPAALLRNPSYKRPAWQDFQMIRDEYNKVK